MVKKVVTVVLSLNMSFESEQKQAGAELGQAQLKLGLDFILIFRRFGFSWFGLVELVGLSFVGLIK